MTMYRAQLRALSNGLRAGDPGGQSHGLAARIRAGDTVTQMLEEHVAATGRLPNRQTRRILAKAARLGRPAR